MRRPNILWISFEDTHPFYGCYGDPVAHTPHVDALAASGCRYPNAFSTAGVCAPARSAVITGMYPTSIGTHHMRTTHKNPNARGLPTPYDATVPHYVKCFPEYLRAAGYFCTNNVKTDYQFAPPLTTWDEQGDQAHWRNRPDPDQPFFAVFNPTMTHESGMWEEKCDPDPRFDLNSIKLPPYFPDTPKVRNAMARMYTNIMAADARLGELLQQLEDDGLADNTIVMHWSDHGPLPRGKRWPYDSGIRVPLIVRWPGRLKPGSVSDQLVSTVDLGPTVLSLAGIPLPRHLQGQAFLGDQAAAPRSYIYASRDRHDEAYDMVRAVRDKRFKYLRHYRPELPYLLWLPYRNRHPIVQEWWRLYAEDKLSGVQDIFFRPRPPEELYDIVNDPWETNNLAVDPAYRPELERLRGALADWQQEVGDLGLISEAEMVRRWYPDGDQPQAQSPLCIAIGPTCQGSEPMTGGEELQDPVLVQLHTTTQGGSIAFTLETGEEAVWQLYSQPLRLPPGPYVLRARTCRIGYLVSEETRIDFIIVS